MKIEIELIDPREALPEDNRWLIVYVENAINHHVAYYEATFTDGAFEDEEGSSIPMHTILFWAILPDYQEITKKTTIK